LLVTCVNITNQRAPGIQKKSSEEEGQSKLGRNCTTVGIAYMSVIKEDRIWTGPNPNDWAGGCGKANLVMLSKGCLQWKNWVVHRHQFWNSVDMHSHTWKTLNIRKPALSQLPHMTEVLLGETHNPTHLYGIYLNNACPHTINE
jgi:hypothetical protein